MSADKAPCSVRSLRESLQEYGRGSIGGLLVSLPLLYTMEVWWAGFTIPPLYLLAYIASTFLLLLGYNRYAGIRKDATLIDLAIDSVEEMGIGLLMAAMVLLLLGRITTETAFAEGLGKIVVAAMTMAIGVSVGTSQLGGKPSKRTGLNPSKTGGGPPSGDEMATGEAQRPDTLAQLVLAFCGAILFAANIAPTEEIQTIGIELSIYRLLALVPTSLLLGWVVLFFSGFAGSDDHVRKDSHFWTLFGIATSYTAALLASALMLWVFRRFEGVTLLVALAQTVVLALPATLGASAGRLLIQ